MRFLVRGAIYGDGGIDISWPIWTSPARLAGVRALLAHPELGRKTPDVAVLARFGVLSVRRAQRIQSENFSTSPRRRPWLDNGNDARPDGASQRRSKAGAAGRKK